MELINTVTAGYNAAAEGVKFAPYTVKYDFFGFVNNINIYDSKVVFLIVLIGLLALHSYLKTKVVENK